MDFNKLKEMGLEYAEKGKNAAMDLAERGKTQAKIVSEQAKLAKAQRQLGALVYSLAKGNEENQPLVDKYIEMIDSIEQELFDAVQAILKVKHEEYHSRLGKYAHFDSENIFEGLVVCACCQHNMTRYKSVYNKGRTVAYHFICPRHAMLLDAGCPNAGGLRESDLKAAVYEVLRLQMAMLTDAEAVIQRVSRSSAARSRRTALDNEIVSVQGRLKKLDTLRQTLFESYVDSIVTQADYLFGKSRYEDETRQLERCLQNLQAEKDALPEASPKQNKWFSVFAKFRYEKELSRKMLLALVEKIYVNEDKQVHIVLNYQDDMKKLFQEEV